MVEWFADWFAAEDYEVARQVLQRGVAALYLLAFVSTAAQFRPLLGERGLLPVPRYLNLTYARTAPGLFRWFGYTDRWLLAVAWTGAALSALVVAGIPQLGPPWAPMLVTLLMWLGYLSIVNVGQTFYGFGWESLLLEAGFIVAFLGSWQHAPPLLVLIIARWLVFRLEFGAGLIKMRGGREWRDFTAMDYHHETQPMPGPFSRFFHLLPRPFHRIEVAGSHVTQLIVPFLLFLPQPIASIAAALIIVTQLWLVVSGNFAWLNWLTIVLAFSAVSDEMVRVVIPALPTVEHPDGAGPLWFLVVVTAVSALIAVLSWWPARNLVARRQLMNASFNRWHLVNAYGAFGTVTKQRDEVIIEGTLDETPSSDADWRAYEFKGKPGDPARRPRQFAPYHLRLDWLMWFLALGAGGAWFDRLLQRLLEADRPTLRLLRTDPFSGKRPRWVRARVYRYRFTTRAEKRRTGLWWHREERYMLVPPRALAD